jgi:hypothetical protein
VYHKLVAWYPLLLDFSALPDHIIITELITAAPSIIALGSASRLTLSCVKQFEIT